MTRLTMSSFRTKVSRPGIERTEQGVKVFYTRKQLEAINKRSAAKPAKTVKPIFDSLPVLKSAQPSNLRGI